MLTASSLCQVVAVAGLGLVAPDVECCGRRCGFVRVFRGEMGGSGDYKLPRECAFGSARTRDSRARLGVVFLTPDPSLQVVAPLQTTAQFFEHG
ncbi:hypothetical protein DFP72DRAFT_923378, partial [Ephemerocybe angulata]